MNLEARIVNYKKQEKGEPWDYNISYGLEINGTIICWFANENERLSEKGIKDANEKIELYTEIVKRINNYE